MSVGKDLAAAAVAGLIGAVAGGIYGAPAGKEFDNGAAFVAGSVAGITGWSISVAQSVPENR